MIKMQNNSCFRIYSRNLRDLKISNFIISFELEIISKQQEQSEVRSAFEALNEKKNSAIFRRPLIGKDEHFKIIIARHSMNRNVLFITRQRAFTFMNKK